MNDALASLLLRGEAGRRRRWSRWLVLGAALAITGAAFLISAYFRVLQSYGYLGAFVINFISSSSIILPLPGALAIFSLGAGGLNPWLLGLAAGLGGALGEVTGYGAGFGGSVALEGKPFYNRLVRWMQRRGGITIFLVALIGLIPFDLAGVAAGALRYPLWRFLLLAALGKTPRFMFIAATGGWSIGFLRGWLSF